MVLQWGRGGLHAGPCLLRSPWAGGGTSSASPLTLFQIPPESYCGVARGIPSAATPLGTRRADSVASLSRAALQLASRVVAGLYMAPQPTRNGSHALLIFFVFLKLALRAAGRRLGFLWKTLETAHARKVSEETEKLPRSKITENPSKRLQWVRQPSVV
ncbi:hypothetical protein NDU88_005644 [Pleurodeles waltl]|uniref:Uncharacterized protein n=1 Tax=Pleurodeles waltl TaxID=8319 RepID=A0AAV7LPP6_PLEWA|nr:hypothetical protein NDU88_005644 [Pleurodeles waltl]